MYDLIIKICTRNYDKLSEYDKLPQYEVLQ